eukprot:755040-Hanusia_phi.AAC.2
MLGNNLIGSVGDDDWDRVTAGADGSGPTRSSVLYRGCTVTVVATGGNLVPAGPRARLCHV